MNPILGLIGGNVRGGGNNVMMQAVAAMMRGESAESFMQNLAKTNPNLQNLNLSNLEQTAHQISQANGIDETQLTNQIKSNFKNFM